ncbi:MAG TPA: glycosyltransferase [Thermoanaerobaculia bacterium]|jgi:GT2 family glycosyltransferase|nr:glycosyltransferase [Thermoanaerobaculia bacterium]
MSPERYPVVVAGMHRSGTSLVASILSSLGVGMGERQLAADRHNPRGYFEDLDFLALNREMLRAAASPDDGGHPDWGWTESERLDRDRFAAYRERAGELVVGHGRAAGTPLWGWKDPRSTLLLDFWDPLLAGARYVLVYRFPWEVADSMQRLGAEVFLRRPDYAWRIWAFYNRHLLDFHRRHRERSLLVSTDVVLREPSRLLALLQERLSLDPARARAEEIIDPELFQSPGADDPLIALAAAAHPDCAALLADLDAAADLSAAGLWSDAPPQPRSVSSEPPRVSVVIPCYDQGELLLEAVASVERSIEEPCELIVVNDGSREPRTHEVLDLLRRSGYRIVDRENGGLAAARNTGIELARAPYILPLDADNRLRPGFVTPALAILDAQPQVAAVYGDRYDFGLRNGMVDVPPFDLDSLLPFNFIDACALLRKEVWSACGGYDPGMPAPGWEDWDLWIGAAERGWQLHHLPGEAFDYRVRPSSMISLFADEERRRRMHAYIIAKHRDLYWQRLPEILVASQRSAAELFRLAREHERAQAEIAAAFQDQETRIGLAAAERASLEREIGALRAQCERLDRDCAVPAAERERLLAELGAWRERVSFMEGTRTWRLRNGLLRLRGRILPAP